MPNPYGETGMVGPSAPTQKTVRGPSLNPQAVKVQPSGAGRQRLMEGAQQRHQQRRQVSSDMQQRHQQMQQRQRPMSQPNAQQQYQMRQQLMQNRQRQMQQPPQMPQMPQTPWWQQGSQYMNAYQTPSYGGGYTPPSISTPSYNPYNPTSYVPYSSSPWYTPTHDAYGRALQGMQ